MIPAGRSVLDNGCGSGDLLAALRPSRGLGIDISARMIERACKRHPGIEFVEVRGEGLRIEETFDYIVMSDLVPYADDLQALFETAARHAHPDTRIVIHSYSQVWRPVIRLAELLRLKPRKPIGNWVSPDDVKHLLTLADLEPITVQRRILMPRQVPLVTWLANAVLANVWPLGHLCLTYWVVARPRPQTRMEELGVSVVCPCRNEAGTVSEIVERTPEMGREPSWILGRGGPPTARRRRSSDRSSSIRSGA